jgi:hypothetical protein
MFSYIGSVNSSAKIKKGEKIGLDTFVVYLAPALLSGFNVCPKATKECITGCLNTSGRVIMDTLNRILNARIARTKLFYSDRDAFVIKVAKEIQSAYDKAKRKDARFAVRLNGTSDLSPAIFRLGRQSILDIFPNVQFYDYTKVLNRIELTKKYPNYDLTFSYSGHNWDECLKALNQGIRVAVVFNTKKGQPLPATYKGFPVIDGDVTDYRPDDAKSVIVGLRFKRIRDKQAMAEVLNSDFVVKA